MARLSFTASTRPMMNSEKMNVANEQLAARRKAARMLISVVVAFAVCYFPVHLLNILRYVANGCFTNNIEAKNMNL